MPPFSTKQAPFDKKQYLLSHGYNEDEANVMLAGANPIKKREAPPAQVSQISQPTVSPDFLSSMRTQGKTDDYIADQMAAKSPHLAGQLTKIRKKFNADPAATTAFLNTRFYGDTSYTPTQSGGKANGYMGRTLDRIYQHGVEFGEDLDAYNRGEITSGQAVLRTASHGFRGVLSPATELSSTVVGGILGSDLVTGVAKDVADSQLGQSVGSYLGPKIQGVQQWAEALPEGSGYRDLADVGMAGVDALDVLGTGAAVNLGKRGLVQGVTHPWQTVRHPGQSLSKIWKGPKGPPDDGGGGGGIPPSKKTELVGTAKEAVNKGMDENTVRFIAEQNADTRAVMGKMTIEADKGGRVLGGTVKHKEILGGQMLDNAAYLLDEKQTVGKALGAMKNAVADDVVDLTDDYLDFLKTLRNKGAVINDQGKIVSLAGAADDNIPLLQRTLEFLQPDDVGRVSRKGKAIDQWRQKMFEEMNSAKAKLQPSSAGQSTFGFAEDTVNDVRRASLVRMAKGNRYMIAANDAFEELSTKTSKFLKSIGYKGKINVESITAKDLRAGEIAMRTLGNASADTREAFTDLIDAARKYGRISNVDEMALIRYADALEDLFPIMPTRSLGGQVSRGTKDALGQFTEDVVRGGAKKGVIEAVSGKVMEGIDVMRGITPENKLRLLMEILNSPPDTPFFKIIDDVLPESVVDDIVENYGKPTLQRLDAGDVAPVAANQIDDVVTTGGKSIKASDLDDVPLSQIDDVEAARVQGLDGPKALAPNGANNDMSLLAEKAKKFKSADEFAQKVLSGESDALSVGTPASNAYSASLPKMQSRIESIYAELNKMREKGLADPSLQPSLDVSSKPLLQELRSLRDQVNYPKHKVLSDVLGLTTDKAQNIKILKDFYNSVTDKSLSKKFPNLTPEEIASLTPEEKATGLIGGSDGAAKGVQTVPIGKVQSGLDPVLEARKGFTFIRNTEKSAKVKNMAQDIEPAGKYMTIAEKGSTVPKGWETGEISFKNPLIIEWASPRPGGWKTNLSKMFGGKTGKALSQEIANNGYDGIITVDGKIPQEVVSLKDFYSQADQ